MKKLQASLLALVSFVVLSVLAPSANAQTMLVMTTLSTAVQGMGSVNGATPIGSMSIAGVASATGISGPAPNTSLTSGLSATSEAQDYLYVDRELMEVKAVNGTTITVIRGVGSTSAVSHASGALVVVVPTAALGIWSGGGAFGAGPSMPQGSCTRTSEPYLPRLSFTTGIISDCLGGQWVNGDAAQTSRTVNFNYPFPNPGAVVYTGVGTSTAKATNTMYCTEMDLPYNKYITGLAVLNGATATTDKEIAVLYDNGGNLLANSAVAGTLAATASVYQKRAFVTPYYAVGPAQYFACIQGDAGTTATLNLIATGNQDTYLTQGYGSQTFGTIPATITVPTAFTTLKGPYFFAY
jgi:hypothetical protein